MTRYDVTARYWKHRWELHIDGVGVTQSQDLAEAEPTVRDYINSLAGAHASGAATAIRSEASDGLGEEARAAREAVAVADRATRERCRPVP